MKSEALQLFAKLHRLSAADTRSPLKEGQMVTGKIEKLLPDNRAIVRLGTRQLHAQLEASLTTGKSYWFRVHTAGDTLRLKMLSENAFHHTRQGLEETLENLGTKKTSGNLALFQSLIHRKIPFHKQALKQAMTLFTQFGESNIAREVLEEMLHKQLPIKESVFQSLLTRRESSLTILIGQMEQYFSGKDSLSRTDEDVIASLSRLKGNGSAPSFLQTLVSSLLKQVVHGEKTGFHLLQTAGIVNKEVPFSEFQRVWLQWGKNQGLTPESTKIPAAQTDRNNPLSHAKPLPYGLNSGKIINDFIHLFQDQLPKKAVSHMKVWLNEAELYKNEPSVVNGQRLLDTHNQLKKHNMHHLIKQTIHASVKDEWVNFVNSLSGNIDSKQVLSPAQKQAFDRIRASLEEVLAKQVTDQSGKFLVNLLLDAPVGKHAKSPLPLNKELLLSLKSMLLFSGIDSEANMKADIKSGDVQSQGSLKTMLLHLLQRDSDTPVKPEPAMKLLQFLNGLQLTAIQETNHSLQMNMVFPGSILKSAEDVQMDFEGRKNEAGEVDPAFCHVLFYLNLENLQETVVDMSINDRRVQLTVFNENPHKIIKITENYQSMLADGLDKLGYELLSVKLRGLNDRQLEKKAGTPFDQLSDKGVDVRI
ncbi:hypothetical protein [Thalassobacillus pellis]|uniref:hypothetical protein n=1 Tax=Thalassobacillus pellis TaxID=748008 RepID=UPI0019606006|nr:hypothetical protein [Thalassobacillus pellis]MBM7552767.1 hypothetical protein [Thalassobacillus pellis]